MKKVLQIIILLLFIIGCVEKPEKSKEMISPVIAPFSDVDTLAVNDWWNRADNPIINLKVNR